MTTSDGPSPHVELHHLGGAADSVALVCVPYAGGSTAIFRSWPKSLPSIDFYALGLPGREARLAAPPFTALDPLVASAVEALQPLAERPFALFGHSMGGLIAFETARRLLRNNAAVPVYLFVSGLPSAAPLRSKAAAVRFAAPGISRRTSKTQRVCF
jgi:medium-chain acyl-[acyl-carrier-protein] hydrolase